MSSQRVTGQRDNNMVGFEVYRWSTNSGITALLYRLLDHIYPYSPLVAQALQGKVWACLCITYWGDLGGPALNKLLIIRWDGDPHHHPISMTLAQPLELPVPGHSPSLIHANLSKY